MEPCAKAHLAEIAEEHARGVVECAVVEDLVVQEVVREPAALLPEKRLRQWSQSGMVYVAGAPQPSHHQTGGSDYRQVRVTERQQRQRDSADGKVT